MKAHNNEDVTFIEKSEPTYEENKAVYEVYGAIMHYCKDKLEKQHDHRSQFAWHYAIHTRHLNEQTIKNLNLGYMPKEKKTPTLYHHLRRLGFHADVIEQCGIFNKSGYISSNFQDCLIFPYLANGEVKVLRARSLDRGARLKYVNPATTYFAGGTPIFFLHDVLEELRALEIYEIILTEGEIKAVAAYQAWLNNKISIPAVSTPGIAYLPDELINQLHDFTVYLAYDVEERKDPFVLSPGENFTIKNGKKIIGWGVEAQLLFAQEELTHAKKELEKVEKTEDETQIEKAKQELAQKAAKVEAELSKSQKIKERNIKVKVIRLYRSPDEKKVDLDSFINAYGPAQLEAFISHAIPLDKWISEHGTSAYKFHKYGIYLKTDRLANYQAIIVEDIKKFDGEGDERFVKVALKEEGKYGDIVSEVEIRSITWARSDTAMVAIRANLSGTAVDLGAQTLNAIKALSNMGDGPNERLIHTVTGWEHRSDGALIGWHYFTQDGTINRQGISTNNMLKAEPNSNLKGMHYKLCGEGDPKEGFLGVRTLLNGDIAPSSICHAMLAHVMLAPIHRFASDHARPTIYLYGESGSFKTSLARVFLSFYGADFTIYKADGKSVYKFGTDSAKMMLTAAYYMRDVPTIFDDYKQATTNKRDLAFMLHSYAEDSGRGTLTKTREVADVKKPRGIAFITAESLPPGDRGQLGRILPFPLGKGGADRQRDVDPEALAYLQLLGEDGHLAALTREYIQWIAAQLDQDLEGFQRKLKEIVRNDNCDLGATHHRVMGALRQNYLAWSIFCSWLSYAGYLTDRDLEIWNLRYEDARKEIAEAHTEASQDESPAEKFMAVLIDALNSGDVVLEGQVAEGYGFEFQEMVKCTRCGCDDHSYFYFLRESRKYDGAPAYHCESCGEFYLMLNIPKGYRLDGFPAKPNVEIIGFYAKAKSQPIIAIYPQKTFTYVQQMLSRRGERINYNAKDVWAQLYSGGYLARVEGKKLKRYDPKTTNPITKSKIRCLNIYPEKLLGEPRSEDDPPDQKQPKKSPPVPPPFAWEDEGFISDPLPSSPI